MSDIDTTVLADDLRAIFSDFSQKITFLGTEYDCAATDIDYSQELIAEGLNDVVTFSCVIINADFTTVPQRNQKITHNGKEMRIIKANPCADGISITLHCVELTA